MVLLLAMFAQIKERIQNGFRPFRVHLSDGRKFEVPVRDFIALHPRTLVIIDAAGISHTIDPSHVASLSQPKEAT